MEFTTTRAAFKGALDIIKHGIAQRSTLLILGYVYIDVGEGVATLTATDLEKTISVPMPCSTTFVRQNTALVLPGKLLTEFIDALPDEEIRVVGDDEKFSAEFTCGRHTATIRGMDPEEYPNTDLGFKTGGSQFIASVSAVALNAALRRVVGAASKDDNRPVLAGVYFESHTEGSGVTVVGADGFRLAIAGISEFLDRSEPVQWIIPARVVKELIALLPKKADSEAVIDIDRTANANQLRFGQVGAWTLTTRLVEGTYPPFGSIIPARWESRVTVERDELIAALRVAAIFAKENAGVVRVNMGRENLTLESTTSEVGDSAVTLPTYLEGTEGTFAVNVDYLLAALDSMTANVVHLEQEGSGHPIMVRPEGEDASVIIMPMQEAKFPASRHREAAGVA